jgi:hypothetical protein
MPQTTDTLMTIRFTLSYYKIYHKGSGKLVPVLLKEHAMITCTVLKVQSDQHVTNTVEAEPEGLTPIITKLVTGHNLEPITSTSHPHNLMSSNILLDLP